MDKEENQRKHIVSFARNNNDVAALQFIQDDPEGVQIKLIVGHGLVNYVFLVKSSDNKSSIVLKYGEETIRCMPDEKVSLSRQELEYNSLCLMQSIQPGSVPEPICFDKSHQIMAMHDMSSWDLLGSQLEERHVDLKAAANLGQLLGKVHRETSKNTVTEEKWKMLLNKFEQSQLKEQSREMTLDRLLIETDPFVSVSDSNLELYRQIVSDIKEYGWFDKSSELYNEQTCFIHADCHQKAIFVKDGQAALFDFEFAFLGHPAYNVAMLASGYLMMRIRDEHHVTSEQLASGPSNEEFKSQCLQAIQDFMESYLKEFGSESPEEPFISSLVLFIGGLLFITSLFKGVEDIFAIKDVDRSQMMSAGRNLMEAHENIRTMQDFMRVLHRLS